MQLHRLDGPAHVDCLGYMSWFFNGDIVAEYFPETKTWEGEFYDWTIEQGMEINSLTEEDKNLIKLTFSR